MKDKTELESTNKKIKLYLAISLIILLTTNFILFRKLDTVHIFEENFMPTAIEGIIYILIYIAFTLSFIPRAALSIAGGFLFGITLGTIYSLIASYIAASISFIIARYLARDWIEIKAPGKILKIKNGVESLGWKFIALSRLLPVLPFSVLNYGLGLTRISFIVYIINTMIFIIPICIMYAYLGRTSHSLLYLLKNLI